MVVTFFSFHAKVKQAVIFAATQKYCIKMCNKAVTLDENPWRDFKHPILLFYRMLAL